MPVDKLVEALIQPVESEAMLDDMVLKLTDMDEDAELTTVDNEFDTLNSWPPLIASVLVALIAPGARFVIECPVMSRY